MNKNYNDSEEILNTTIPKVVVDENNVSRKKNKNNNVVER